MENEGDDDLNHTIVATGTQSFGLEAQLEAMRLQMEEMSKNLNAERKERQRLTALFDHHSSSSIQPSPLSSFKNNEDNKKLNTAVMTPTQNIFPSSELPPTKAENPSPPPNENANNSTSFVHVPMRRKIEDLPAFSGRPEEWPAFSVAFRESNLNLKYTDWENHLRLNKSLSGAAKEAVEALMIHPKNVEEVMSELERQFGQHEQLLRSQLAKVRQIQPIVESRLDQIIPFATKVRNLAAFLETIGSIPHLANPNLIEELVKKLPPSKRVDWGMYAINIKPYTTVRDFSNWLSQLAHVINIVHITTSNSLTSTDKPNIKHTGTKPKVLHTNVVSSSSNSNKGCSSCNGNHFIIECEDFKAADINERWSIVKNRHLCFSCLRTGHSTFNCRSRRPCKKNGCKKVHNVLLHEEEKTVVGNANSTQGPSTSRVMNCVKAETDVLFKIVPVRLYGPCDSIETFAMFDEGSSFTLVDESLLDNLGIRGKEEQLTLQWFGNHTSSEPSQVVEMDISAIGDNMTRYKLKEVRSVKKIDLPLQTLNISKLHREHRSIKKLPINSYTDAKPLLLIGLNNSFLGAPSSSIKTSLVAVKTKLGWVVYGSYQTSLNSPRSYQLHIRKPNDDFLEKAMADYFTSENFGVQPCSLETESDKQAKQLLKTTTVRLNNKYQTGLLWKDPNVLLPRSYEMAKKRLLTIEKKMDKNAEFKEIYVKKMDELLQKGYARKLNPSEVENVSDRTWYLHHFIVSNLNKPGKHRLVFDAAAKVGGESLNDFLLKGPDVYNKLIEVLYNFRLNKIGVCADIREMFSQVLIQPSDQNSQRFLWRPNGDKNRPIEEYIMQVMTFGMTCSPASAHYVKNINAQRFMETNPDAMRSIIDHHYVDDFVDSFANVEAAKRISLDVKEIHKQAGFELRGFTSNSAEVADFLNNSPTQERKLLQMDLESTATEKILGMMWNTYTDNFEFKLKFNRVPKDVLNGTRRPTKREILSVIMSVFDPFGLLANITIHLKVMVQELWRSGIDWDEEIVDSMNAKWIAFHQSKSNFIHL